MTALYVLTDGASLRKRGERLVVLDPQGTLLDEFELRHLHTLVILNTVLVTTQALTQLLAHAVELAIITRNGKLLGQLTPPTARNIQLRKLQFEKERDTAFALELARQVVLAKVRNQQQVLLRFALDEPGDQPQVQHAASQIQQLLPAIDTAGSADVLRGLEGACARHYWQAFGWMCKAEGICFPGRRHHPPTDPLNSVLSFGYTLLTAAMHSLLDALGFDPFLGFFHQDCYGRPSLALDLLEPLRAPVVDRLALRLFNLRMLRADDFEADSEGGVRMKKEALPVFFRQYENTLARLDVRRLLGQQAEGLRRVLLGQKVTLDLFHYSAR